MGLRITRSISWYADQRMCSRTTAPRLSSLYAAPYTSSLPGWRHEACRERETRAVLDRRDLQLISPGRTGQGAYALCCFISLEM